MRNRKPEKKKNEGIDKNRSSGVTTIITLREEIKFGYLSISCDAGKAGEKKSRDRY